MHTMNIGIKGRSNTCEAGKLRSRGILVPHQFLTLTCVFFKSIDMQLLLDKRRNDFYLYSILPQRRCLYLMQVIFYPL